ncbi:hypothetical protein [Vibrio parahaemolyticus]|uniref:hypothetical protein n=1 Tax=Vibrio parahaemolyticus TaxID=670 RepID=UPI00320E0176
MGRLEKLLTTRLQYALRLPRPKRHPRTIEEQEHLDFYYVCFWYEGQRYLVESIEGVTLLVRKLSDEDGRYEERSRLPLNEVFKSSFEITHEHGLVQYIYKSRIKFLIYEVLKLYVVHSYLSVVIWKCSNCWYRRQKLMSPTRFNTLEAIDKLTENNIKHSFDFGKIVELLYGRRIYLHPRCGSIIQRVKLILSSLEESGEIQKDQTMSGFMLKGKALATLEHLREEANREKRTDTYTKLTVTLTVILAIAAAFQSGLVKTTYSSSVDWLIGPLFSLIDFVRTSLS